MLNLIAEKLGSLVPTTWVDDMKLRGDEVKLFREYYDGDHRLKLTSEMKNMLQITDARLDRYNANYCEMVVNSMADRLTVDSVKASSGIDLAAVELAAFLQERLPDGVNAAALAEELTASFGMDVDGGGDDPLQGWVEGVLEQNRFDGLQIEVREALLRDGDTFLMCQFEEGADGKPGFARLAHESAWDGDTGTMVIYDRQGKQVVAGVKVWYEGDERRVNLYYQDAVEKFWYDDGRPATENDEKREPSLKERRDKKGDYAGEYRILTTRDSGNVGVPIVHFSNKGGPRGKSELVNVIPLQDSLNRTLHSMVMTAELTAFSVLFTNTDIDTSKGLTPGMIFSSFVENWLSEDNADKLRAMAAMLGAFKLERIEPGTVEPLIKQADWIIAQIATITSTPIAAQMGGDSQSGEALKQRDTRLLGKIQRAQVQVGNRWEDAIRLAWRVERYHGGLSRPEIDSLNTRWKGAEIRNDAEILMIADKLHEWGYEHEALRTLSQTSAVEFNEDKIKSMIDEKAQAVSASIGQIGAQLPALEAAGASVGAGVGVPALA